MHMACDIVDFISFVTFKRKIDPFFSHFVSQSSATMTLLNKFNTEKNVLNISLLHTHFSVSTLIFCFPPVNTINNCTIFRERLFQAHKSINKTKQKYNFIMLHNSFLYFSRLFLQINFVLSFQRK